MDNEHKLLNLKQCEAEDGLNLLIEKKSSNKKWLLILFVVSVVFGFSFYITTAYQTIQVNKPWYDRYIRESSDKLYPWALDDFDQLTVGNSLQEGDRFEEIIRQYGKASRIEEDGSNTEIVLHYTDFHQPQAVFLTFRPDKGAKYYLTAMNFMGFPVPDELGLTFNPDGQDIRKENIPSFRTKINETNSHFLEELLSVYREPDDIVYSKYLVSEQTTETLLFVYHIKNSDHTVVLHLAKPENDKEFTLTHVEADW